VDLCKHRDLNGNSVVIVEGNSFLLFKLIKEKFRPQTFIKQENNNISQTQE